jgi:type II secretory pathway pseudopilin PulG
MLTVIAIIGVLAGILIPTVQVAMKKARMVTASADVSHLYQAATAYNLDFGAFPPDQPFDSSGNVFVPFPSTLNPNELLMWYLTRQYSNGNLAAGYPAGYPANWSVPPAYDTVGGWTPTTATAVFSRVNAGPYFDMKVKQRRSWTFDSSNNPYYDFVDPWGRPYMYRAYPLSGSATVSTSGNTATISLSPPLGNGNITYNVSNLQTSGGSTVGSIQLTGALNGTYTYQATGSSTVSITNNNLPSLTNAPCQYSFPLHNQQTCDIYSLGPYGLTRAASMPIARWGTPPPPQVWTPSEWKPTHGGAPYDNTSLDAWPLVWGTSGDGNDINSTGGNTIVNVLYQDNICNWQ